MTVGVATELFEHRWGAPSPVHELEHLAATGVNGVSDTDRNVDFGVAVEGDEALISDGVENGEVVVSHYRSGCRNRGRP